MPVFSDRIDSRPVGRAMRAAGRLAALLTLSLAVFLPASNASAAGEAPVRAAFAITELKPGGATAAVLEVEIDEGWHVNANEPSHDFLIPTTIEFELPEGVTANKVAWPPTVERALPLAGGKTLELYEEKFAITVVLRAAADADLSEAATARLRYQACDDNVCLRPATIELPMQLGGAAGGAAGDAGDAASNAELGRIAGWVEAGPWVTIPAMIGLGLVLNLTPCVYPLILVTLAYFGGQSGGSRVRKFRLAVIYVLGIALTFSAVGASAALSGSFFGAAIAKPGVQLALSALMVALALSTFGLYQLQVPASITTKLGGSNAGALGALGMGATMGLVAAPCVGPVVVGLLIYVGSQGDVAHGVWLFFLLALGLGLPYIVLATAAGSISSLPRSGAWLQWTEHLFGCILLAMALYFAGGLLPDNIEHWLMAAFLAGAIVFLAFIDKAGSEFRTFLLGRRAAGVAALLALGFVYLPSGQAETGLVWQDFSADSYDTARRSGNPFVIEFGAEWCLPCKEMEERTFTDSDVLAASEGMTFISVDMTTSDNMTDRILKSFKVFGAPTTIFYGPDGKEWFRKIGFIGPVDFADYLRKGFKAGEADGGQGVTGT